MPKNCVSYFQKGVKAAVLNGYDAQNMSACNIKRIQKGISAPGLGKPGGSRSRKASRKARRGTRRMRGGAGSCVAALQPLLPGPMDWERMVEQDSEAVDPDMTYQQWKADQIAQVKALTAEDCEWLTGLCERVQARKMFDMDMESTVAFTVSMVFFHKDGGIVVANDR